MISKKNIILFIILGTILFGAIFYLYYYEPKKASIEQLKIAKMDKEIELNNVLIKIATEDDLDADITIVNDEIEKLSSRMFVDLKQEEALKISNNLASKEFLIDKVTFSESYDEATSSVVITEIMDVDSDYLAVMKYMSKIRKYNKNIAITSISFIKNEVDNETSDAAEGIVNSDEDANANSEKTTDVDKDYERTEGAYSTALKIRMNLEYRSVPSLISMGKVDKKLLSDILSSRDMAKGPFEKYEGYVEKVEPVSEIKADANQGFDYEDYVPKTPVYDFEDGSAFFVASDSESIGHVVRSQTRVNGGYSSDLTFDFVTAREYNSASLVFENNRITLSKQPETFYLNVYAYESSNHGIGMVILDSAGKDYKIYFVNNVDWTDWKELSVELPKEINYPCVIQRIFVEGVGYEQKLSGRYLFDRLEVAFP